MKILCSGNPQHQTVANGVKQIYPEADFASRATGFDLRFWSEGSELHFRNAIANYTVFVNSSFVCGWGQHQLLTVTHEVWSTNNTPGHIINIGSTAEFLGRDSQYASYTVQKQALQKLSLSLNGKNKIKTSHIIVGGINDGKPGHEDWLNVRTVAETIKFVIEHPYNITLLALE